MQQKGNVLDVQEKLKAWKDFIKTKEAKNMVFLDESSVNTNITRRYGSSIRVVVHTSLNTPVITTVLSSIRTDGSQVVLTYQGGTTGARFVAYLKEHLLLSLKAKDVVIMDNLRSPHVRAGKFFRRLGLNIAICRPTVLILILWKKCGRR